MRCCELLAVSVVFLESTASAIVHAGFDPQNAVRRILETGTRPVIHNDGPRDDGEFLVDTSRAHGPAPGSQRDVAVAFDGANFLVVWTDERGSYADIHGTRVNRDGTVLDPDGILISTSANTQQLPTVAYNGTCFLVVWQDDRNLTTNSTDIYGARVGSDGVVLDTAGIALSSAESPQNCPAVASSDSMFLVVWHDGRNADTDVYGTRVSPAGVVLDPGGIAVATAAGSQSTPSVAFDGANFLVVWAHSRGSDNDICGSRVSPAGNVIDSSGIAISSAESHQLCPAAVSDGVGTLVVWCDFRTGDPHIYGARVDRGGVVLDPEGFGISSSSAPGQYNPASASDSAGFLVVWEDDRTGSYDIYGARVSRSGVVLDPGGVPVSTEEECTQWLPSVAYDGTNCFVVWDDYRYYSDPDVFGARVNPNGAVLDPVGIVVSLAAPQQESPATASSEDCYLVAWTDDRQGPYECDVYATRVGPSGVVLDPDGLAVSTRARDQFYPAVGSDGASFLVVWWDCCSGSGDIYGARVSQGGVVLDSAGIPISSAAESQSHPAVAFDGVRYFVVWQDKRHGTADIYGARIGSDGSVLDPTGIGISVKAASEYSPDVVFDGRDFLVVWSAGPSGGTHNIYAARVSPAGAVLDPDGIAVSLATNDQREPTIACDGVNCMVVWHDYRDLNVTSVDIYGARVSPDGVVLDPDGIPVSTVERVQELPAAVFLGSDFLVVWHDYRNYAVTSADIYGARVSPVGVVLESGPVVRQHGDQQQPVLALGPANTSLLFYRGWTGTVGSRTYNRDRIWGKIGPNPGIEEAPTAGFPAMNAQTIVRGSLFLPPALLSAHCSLFDSNGREVMELRPGTNDVSRLSPGVYFVRDVARAEGHVAGARTAKVILTK